MTLPLLVNVTILTFLLLAKK